MSEGQNLKGALEMRRQAAAIAADTDLSESAKLFAFCLMVYLADVDGKGVKRKEWVEAVGEMMCGDADRGWFGNESWASFKVRRVIGDDVPRYQLPYKRVQCQVTKVRGPNTGKPCGRNASNSWVEYDVDTGEATHVGYCSSHMRPEYQRRHHENYQAWAANGKPVPRANRGGILARYFKTDWNKLYKWAAPHTEALPEGKPKTPPRPTLRLIKGGGGDD